MGKKGHKTTVIITCVLFLGLMTCVVNADVWNPIESRWELTAEEYKYLSDQADRSGCSYNYNRTYIYFDQAYLREMSTNLSRAERLLDHYRNFLLPRAYNNTIPVRNLNIYLNRTLDEGDIDAIKGNLSGSYADSLFINIVANNYTDHYTEVVNQSIRTTTNIQNCSAVPEIAEELTKLQFKEAEVLNENQGDIIQNQYLIQNEQTNIKRMLFIFTLIIVGLILFYNKPTVVEAEDVEPKKADEKREERINEIRKEAEEKIEKEFGEGTGERIEIKDGLAKVIKSEDEAKDSSEYNYIKLHRKIKKQIKRLRDYFGV